MNILTTHAKLHLDLVNMNVRVVMKNPRIESLKKNPIHVFVKLVTKKIKEIVKYGPLPEFNILELRLNEPKFAMVANQSVTLQLKQDLS